MKKAFLISIMFILLTGFWETEKSDRPDPGELMDKEIPEFSGTDLKGVKWDNEKLLGKVTLINFWFIGCPPCMKEIKHLNDLKDDYKDDDFILISIAPQVKNDLLAFNDTTSKSKFAKVRDLTNSEPIEYPVIPECKEKQERAENIMGPECQTISKDFKVYGYPSTFIIDKKGTVRYIMTGFTDQDEGGEIFMKEYKEVIDNLLKE